MIWTAGPSSSRLGAVDGSVREPVGWRGSALTGLGLGAPAAGAVLLFANMAADGLFGAAIVWLILVPVLACTMLAATGFEIGRRGWPLRRWWWAIVLAPGLAVVLFCGTLAGGPSGSTVERAAGWAMVTVAVSTGVAVAAGRQVVVWIRGLAVVVAVAAAPAMVGFDHMSQYRWRKADLAGLPEVVPVIAGYRPQAARAEFGTLQIDMAGTTRLVVWIYRCRGTCTADDVTLVGTRTFVASGYELTVFQANGDIDVLTTLSGVDVRPTSYAELARLPLAPSQRSSD
jgi:hypothetical protein